MKKIILSGLALVFAVVMISCVPTPADNPGVEEEAITGLENGEFDLDVEGRTIHYRIHGTGPEVMVLTNSWGITTKDLRNLFKCMEADFTMIYFDSRGMGGSSPVSEPSDMGIKAVRDDFETVRNHLKLEKVILLGWSNGAMNATPFLLEHPDSVSKAVMLHGSFYVDPSDMARIGQEYPELMPRYMKYMTVMNHKEKGDEEKEAYHREFMLDVLFPMIYKDSEAGRVQINELFKDATFSYRHNGYTQTVDLAGFDMRESLQEISVPVLVIAGAHDMNPASRLEEGAKAMQNATYVLFEDSGHYAMLEENEKFMEVIKEFLTE